MSNQFDSDLLWRRTESLAIHDRTGACCRIWDGRIGVLRSQWPEKPWSWTIVGPGVTLNGWSASEASARAAVRRRLAKLPDRACADDTAAHSVKS